MSDIFELSKLTTTSLKVNLEKNKYTHAFQAQRTLTENTHIIIRIIDDLDMGSSQNPCMNFQHSESLH